MLFQPSSNYSACRNMNLSMPFKGKSIPIISRILNVMYIFDYENFCRNLNFHDYEMSFQILYVVVQTQLQFKQIFDFFQSWDTILKAIFSINMQSLEWFLILSQLNKIYCLCRKLSFRNPKTSLNLVSCCHPNIYTAYFQYHIILFNISFFRYTLLFLYNTLFLHYSC